MYCHETDWLYCHETDWLWVDADWLWVDAAGFWDNAGWSQDLANDAFRHSHANDMTSSVAKDDGKMMAEPTNLDRIFEASANTIAFC